MLEDANKVPEYTNKGLRKKDLKKDPIEQFKIWYEKASELGPLEATTMALSTVSADGQASLRSVLLKDFDARGFVFFTNYESNKAKEIEGNHRVALLLRWLPHYRQVIILGSASKISPEESRDYFLTRPRETQLGAWASRQSSVVSSRDVLDEKLMEMESRFSDGDVPLPPFWGGYRVNPQSLEFWNGRPNRLHDRFIYTRLQDDSWGIERLSP
jgi:pyridoxamine 5'-phosphate oxidase